MQDNAASFYKSTTMIIEHMLKVVLLSHRQSGVYFGTMTYTQTITLCMCVQLERHCVSMGTNIQVWDENFIETDKTRQVNVNM